MDMTVFGLGLDQISFNLVENAIATQQLAGLATSIAFYDILTYVFRLFIFNFFVMSFFSISTGLASNFGQR